jgi:hypothetical protein
VPGDHIRLSASHTHSGPSLDQPWFEAGAGLTVEESLALLSELR